jgi:hypothetical protein
MKDILNHPTCDRADDLISFLYGESNEREALDFNQHLQACANCQNEFASLGGVRESIALWKAEALSAARVEVAQTPMRRRSAVAALREFFALSPLWMKGAVGFAAVVFCVMAILLVNRTSTAPPSITTQNDLKYREQDMKEAIAKALEEQAKSFTATAPSNKQKEVKQLTEPIQNRQVAPANRAAQWASRRPLSKAERQQLASDLRLLSTREEDALNLLGDRINQEF